MVGNGVLTGVLGVIASCVVVCVRGPCGGLWLVFFLWLSFMRVLMCVSMRHGVNGLVFTCTRY